MELEEPRFPVLYNLGNAFFYIQRLEEAVDVYKRALVLQESSECHFNIAVAFTDMGRIPDAILHYQEAIRLDSENIDAYLNLGRCQMQLNQGTDEAAGTFQQVLNVDPENNDALEALQQIEEGVSQL